jgi:hypothetical protein
MAISLLSFWGRRFAYGKRDETASLSCLFVVIMVSFFTADLLRDLSASPAFLNHVAGSGREDEIFLLCARLFFVAVVPYFT